SRRGLGGTAGDDHQRAVGGRGEGIQAIPTRVRARTPGARDVGEPYPLRLVQCVGRGRGQVVRLSHLLVQSRARAHGRPRRRAGYGSRTPRSDSRAARGGTAIGSRTVLKAPGRLRTIRQGTTAPYLLPSRFFFT